MTMMCIPRDDLHWQNKVGTSRGNSADDHHMHHQLLSTLMSSAIDYKLFGTEAAYESLKYSGLYHHAGFY